jgi:hypothetical protein
LDHDYHADTDTDKPQLFLGELPLDLPADTSLPEGMVLLGGLRRVSPWRSEPDAQIIPEAEAEPEGVYAAFREHLAGSEWSEKRRHRAECGGFVSTGSGVRSLTFCLSPRGPALLVSAYRRREAGTTEVRLRLEGSRRDSPCSDDHDCYAYDERAVLPALFPPEGVAQISGGGEAVRVRKQTTPTYAPACPPRRSWGTTRPSWRRRGGRGWAAARRDRPPGAVGRSRRPVRDGWGHSWPSARRGPSEVCFVQVSASAMPEDLR